MNNGGGRLGRALVGVVFGLAVGAVFGYLLAGRERQRLLREQAHAMRVRMNQTAGEVADRVSGTASEAWDRASGQAQEAWTRVGELPAELRDRSTENIGRVVLEAAAAFDAALDPLDDADDPESKAPGPDDHESSSAPESR